MMKHKRFISILIIIFLILLGISIYGTFYRDLDNGSTYDLGHDNIEKVHSDMLKM